MQNIRDNGAKSSINFQRCDLKIAPFHNAREAFLPETSHPELVDKNECSCSALAALKKIKKWDALADEAYLKTYGQKSALKEKNKVWECVINLRENHTLKDVKKLTKKLEKITGYKAAQIAIHKDEGHYEEGTGDFIQNVHAHVIFYARDTETGLSLSAENYRRKDLMRIMQDTVASELGMERGQSAEITGAKHMSPRAFKAQKRQEAAIAQNNKEWEAKMAEKQAEWEQKKAEWERKQAEREAKREEWERKLPEIMARKEQYSQFICDKIDWEQAKTGKMLAREMQILGMNFAGIANPQGNILVEAQKSAIRNIFYMLGATAQLAVFMFNKTLINDEKIKSDAKIYNVEATLLRAVDYIANSDRANGEELKKLIQRKFLLIPEEKRHELFEYAIENAPTEELKNDIRALIEGRFEDIARTEAAQKRIENRDLRQSLREYSEEIRKIRDELREMDEENRILNLAEREILKSRGAGREEYSEQEAQNRERLNDLKRVKDEVKDLNNAIRDQKQSPDKDTQTIRELNEKIAELNEQIRKITAENAKKQKELEAEKAEKQIKTPQMPPKDAFDIIDELEEKLKQPEPKIEPKPEPEPVKPEPKKDDFISIFGYETPKPEPRRRFDDYEPRKREIDERPKYEPEPIREPEPEKIEQREQKDPWKEIDDAIEKWRKTEDVGSKTLMTVDILGKLNAYEKSGWDISLEKQIRMNNFRRVANYDPVAEAEEARKNAETLKKLADMNREREQKRQQTVEIETAIKYEDERGKNVKQEADARQHNIKKKRKDELEFGSI